MNKPEKQKNHSPANSEVVSLKLEKAFNRLENAIDNFRIRKSVPTNYHDSLPDLASIVDVAALEQEIEVLRKRVRELEDENTEFRKKMHRSEPFFETVKQSSSKQQPKNIIGKKESDHPLSQVKNLFDDD